MAQGQSRAQWLWAAAGHELVQDGSAPTSCPESVVAGLGKGVIKLPISGQGGRGGGGGRVSLSRAPNSFLQVSGTNPKPLPGGDTCSPPSLGHGWGAGGCGEG